MTIQIEKIVLLSTFQSNNKRHHFLRNEIDKFRHANSNEKIIIYKFEIIDNVITLNIINNFIDFFREYNIVEFANLKIKIDQNIENIFDIIKQIKIFHIHLKHEQILKKIENDQFKTQTHLKKTK